MLAEILPPETTELADPSTTLRQQVDHLLDEIRDQEYGLAANWARLGAALFEVRRNQYWDEWGYLSFGSYIRELADRVRKERSQLYAYIGTAEKLLPYIAEDMLVAIGISKAGELRRFVAQSGRRLPQPLLTMAVDDKTTVKELRAAVFQELHQEPDPKGTWLDLGGFYALSDEKKEIEDAFRLATLDPLIPHDTPEHLRKKEILLRLSREFIGAYSHLL